MGISAHKMVRYHAGRQAATVINQLNNRTKKI